MDNLKIGILQIDFTLCDVLGNANKIITYYKNNKNLDLLVVGELCISGYLPLDELYKSYYKRQLKKAIENIVKETINQETILIFGDIYEEEKNLFNVAYVVNRGQIKQIIKKQKLVDYDIFNEYRYFKFGDKDVVNLIEVKGFKLGLVICEDLWYKNIVDNLSKLNLDCVVSINASPYEEYKSNNRFKVCKYAALNNKAPVIYSNLVGGVDGVVFDGRSMVFSKDGDKIHELNFVKEDFKSLVLNKNKDIYLLLENNKNIKNINLKISKEEEFYRVIQKGLLDFVDKNNIAGLIIGLSGGIDSSLSATIAADTLGVDRVLGVSIPSIFTSELSKNIIDSLVKNLKIKLRTINLDSILHIYNKMFLNDNEKYINKITEENLQSRIRANILMTISNEMQGYVILSNGNKSELATGYFTLYGDSCGAFNLLKDLYKKDVYNLAKWRNANIPIDAKINNFNIIPEECINREPTAELSYNQRDQDSLPQYSLLDSLLEDIIENNIDYIKLLNKYDKKDIDCIFNLLKKSEYKRKQSPIGVKLSNKSFGKEWQFPITNKFRE